MVVVHACLLACYRFLQAPTGLLRVFDLLQCSNTSLKATALQVGGKAVTSWGGGARRLSPGVQLHRSGRL